MSDDLDYHNKKLLGIFYLHHGFYSNLQRLIFSDNIRCLTRFRHDEKSRRSHSKASITFSTEVIRPNTFRI